MKWLKQRDRSRPFCLNLHFKGPHEPFDYPDRWAHLHEGIDIPEPPSLYEDVEAASPRLRAMHYSMLYHPQAPKSYYLFRKSQLRGMAQTVIIYTSDQGYWLGQHGMFDKRLILEGALKMPFMVRYPREVSAGTAEIEFYDLHKDPAKMTDLAGNPEYASVIKQTEKRLGDLMAEVGITPEFLARHMKNGRKAPPGSAFKSNKRKRRNSTLQRETGL